jgi:hypothetical protein
MFEQGKICLENLNLTSVWLNRKLDAQICDNVLFNSNGLI